jgi:translocator protein
MNKKVTLLFCILLPLAAGAISGFLTSASIPTWYATLIKPSFNPPNYLFGPVWTLLYVMMGLALYMVTQTATTQDLKNKAYLFWGSQMFLNFCWSILFFYFKRIDIAFGEIILMWIMILATIFSFAKINKKAAWLLVPYIAWVSFATVLNGAIFFLNR